MSTLEVNSLQHLDASVNNLDLDSSGNVGIGTASPSGKMHIVDGAGTVPTLGSGTNFIVQNNDDAGDVARLNVIGGTSGYSTLHFGDANSYNVGGVIYNHSSNLLTLDSGGTTGISITSGGDVGVGTSSPDTILHCEGSAPYITLENSSAEDNDTGREGVLRFQGKRSGGEVVINSQISGHHEGNLDDDKGMLIFYTNGGSGNEEKLRLLSSGGITFGGDTAQANALDDYEEGTFTAVLEGSQTAGSSPTTTGYYTKIGNQVHVTWTFTGVTVSGASGNVLCNGLPFSSTAAANGPGGLTYKFNQPNIASYLMMNPSSQYVQHYSVQNQGAWAGNPIHNTSGLHWTASFTYRA